MGDRTAADEDDDVGRRKVHCSLALPKRERRRRRKEGGGRENAREERAFEAASRLRAGAQAASLDERSEQSHFERKWEEKRGREWREKAAAGRLERERQRERRESLSPERRLLGGPLLLSSCCCWHHSLPLFVVQGRFINTTD